MTALLWSCGCGVIYHLVAHPSRRRAGAIIGLAVFSHWVWIIVIDLTFR